MTLPLINPDQPKVTAAGFGRVFFGGGSTLYYSPVLERKEDLGRCYQINDPTSDEISDILDTDGGLLKLQDAGEITELVVYRTGVLVFTDRGVWYVYNNETGFRSTGYLVSKISEEVILDAGCSVEVQGILYFCSRNGVSTIVPNEFDNLSVQSVTDSTVLTFYQGLTEQSFVYPTYDRLNKRVWFRTGITNQGVVLDLRTGGWYPQEFATDDRRVVGILDNTEEILFVNSLAQSLTEVDYNFATESDTTFKDFGEDVTAYLLSGYETLGKFSHKKASTYGSFFFKKTETQITDYDEVEQAFVFDLPSGCTMQARWDFDNSNAFNKWVGIDESGIGSGKSIELYKPMQRGFIPPDTFPWDFDTGESIVSKKIKIRGNGKAVQFLFEAEPEKDLQLLGYSVEFTMRGKQ